MASNDSREFVGLIGEVGLQLVGDSDVTRLLGPREPAAVRAFLDGLPRLEQQQYVDFMTNCTCHGALVCHDGVEIRDRADDRVLRESWVGLATTHRESVPPIPLPQDVLSRLQASRPEFVALSDLAESGTVPTGLLMDAYAARVVDLTLSPPALSGRIGDYPTANPLARLQAREGPIVTNQKCETVRLMDLARHVVTLLDGVHSAGDVAESVSDEIRSGRVPNEWILRLLDDDLDGGRLTGDILRHLRDHALLVA